MSQDDPVITRFAPSPTGFLHIGGARTALFNWLFARGRGGEFLLRIEDTDRERSTPAAEAAILSGLTWLGLDWDGDPVSQYARAEHHRAAAATLLDAGHAYHCYLSPDEVETGRTQAYEKGEVFRSPWRDRIGEPGPAGVKPVVRFKAPLGEDVIVDDAVQGRVTFASDTLDDLILLRSDGRPTYNLAVVVDDHDMGVTHVIRGDDHLANAARQTLIYRALGMPTPVFAHIPLIHGNDGKKLSKRHGALGVDAYRDAGYLPEALRNYLLRLGWSKGDQELFSDAEAQAAFGLDGLNKAPARLDFDKLGSVNAHYLTEAADDRVFALAVAAGEMGGRVLSAVQLARLRAATSALKARAKTTHDILTAGAFALSERPITLSQKAKASLKPDVVERLARLAAALRSVDRWQEACLHDALQHFADNESVGFGKVGAPLRAALTGGAPAPDIALVLEILGREEALGRLDDAQLVTAQSAI